MPFFQPKNPETKEFVFDKDGNAHEIKDGVLTGDVTPKSVFEAQYAPFVKQG